MAVVAILALACAGPTPAEAPHNIISDAPPAVNGVQVNGALSWDVTSKATGRDYRIYVYQPLAPAPPGGYPVVYLTDGDLQFASAVDSMRARQFMDLKPAIIVGIGYPTTDIWRQIIRRNLDLTPARPTPEAMESFKLLSNYMGIGPADTGDAEEFYHFVADEVRPMVAARHQTSPTEQIFYGHSFGGLFGLHVLFNHPQAFSTYLISSPTIQWNNRGVLASEARFSAAVARGEVAPRIMLMVGSEEGAPSKAVLAAHPEMVAALAREGTQVSNTTELAARLKTLKGRPPYYVEDFVFQGENHGSVMPASFSRGLSFALSVRDPHGRTLAATGAK